MTGGQMAPTTLPGQVTQTTPYGRDVAHGGLSRPRRASCSARSTARHTSSALPSTRPKNIRKAKNAIKKAFQNQIDRQRLFASWKWCPPAPPTGA